MFPGLWGEQTRELRASKVQLSNRKARPLMPKFNYVAMDGHGKETKGTLEVASQNEAIARVKEMNLFPTKIVEIEKTKEKGPADKKAAKPKAKKKAGVNFNIQIPGLGGKVKSKVL